MTGSTETQLARYRTLRRVVGNIESELRRLTLWERSRPHPAALESTTPFCYDTLTFHQWLQWLFIPRMERILAGHGGLPAESNIFPYAVDTLRHLGPDADELLFLVKTFDELIAQDDTEVTLQ